jgi:PilZ domain
MPESKVSKAYVREDDSAVLNCPHCGRQKAIPVDKLRGHKHKLKVKCGCKETFTVNLEFRKRRRKKVYLRGTYINHSQKGSSGDIFIQNISVGGLEFSSLNMQDFKVGDELTVEFNLDDEHQFEISKDVIVREVRQRSVGCEFETHGELDFVGPLGHYIMS